MPTLSMKAAARCLLIPLIAFASCKRSGVNAGAASECADGETCYQRAQALLEKNDQEHAGRSDSAAPGDLASRAVALYQRGCDLGSGISCESLGHWLEIGELAPVDLERAARLHERGCALKEFRSCDRLAHLYRDGRGVRKDAALQAKYRKLACDLAEPPMAKPTFCNDN